jgi:hypothetical protein
MLKIHYFHPQWTRRSVAERSSMPWLLQLSNGMVVDARDLPRELQEELYVAGLIPFIPGAEEEE